jgi:hypothetical protein
MLEISPASASPVLPWSVTLQDVLAWLVAFALMVLLGFVALLAIGVTVFVALALVRAGYVLARRWHRRGR